jgi:hypothetical protein
MDEPPEPLEPNDPQDRLIDTLLREALGKETPPNLAGRILERVARERRRFYWLAGGLSAAAAIVIGLAVYKFALSEKPAEVVIEPKKTLEPGLKFEPEPYTPPKPELDLRPSPGEWARGTRIKTDDQPKKLELGGYCKLEAAANSSLVNEGKDKAEQVLLEAGNVTCQVDRHVGTFVVRTDSGMVSVTGTKFNVGIRGDGNDLKTEHAQRRQLTVSVQEGAVELNGWGLTLHAGEEGGVAFGVVSGKEENFIEIREDHAKEPVRYTPKMKDGFDKEMLEQFKKVAVGSRVQVSWVRQELRRIGKLQAVWAKPEGEGQHKSGVVTGIITEKGNEWIRVKEEGREGERYTPRWIPTHDNPKEGSLDKEMLRAFERLNKDDKVRLEWVLEEHRRVIRIEKLEKE